ncbi:hypothetical protein OAK32_01010 [Mariniblastus sp.]|nr:hypothetical protein [Mariniblastus sp.]
MTKKFEENLATSSADSVPNDLFCEMDWGNSEFLESVQPAAINLSELFSCGKAPNAESPYSWMIDGKVSPAAIDSGDRWRVNLNVQSQVAEVADEVVKAVQDYSLNSTCVSEAYLVLAASYSVRKLVGKSDFVQWQGTVERLFDISKAVESNSEISMEAYQWLAIELPLVVSCQFPEWDGRQIWALEAIRKMSLSISELLDHDGWPTTRCLPSFGVIAASWVRCQLIVDAMKDKSVLTQDTGLDVVSQLELGSSLRQLATLSLA